MFSACAHLSHTFRGLGQKRSLVTESGVGAAVPLLCRPTSAPAPVLCLLSDRFGLCRKH